MKATSSHNSFGFTIVELLVVIVIIAILAAITIVSFTGISQKAVASSLQSDLTNAQTHLKLFQVVNSNYPDTINCANADRSTKKCLKTSTGNSFSFYKVNNSASPQTFSLLATNNTTYYQINSASSPTQATPVVASGGTVSTDGPYTVQTFY